LIDGITENANSIVVLALLAVKNLQAKFLIFNLLFTAALVTLKLENICLMLLLNIVVVGNFTMKTFYISS
jgi:hypothetical protein